MCWPVQTSSDVPVREGKQSREQMCAKLDDDEDNGSGASAVGDSVTQRLSFA